MFLVLFDLLLFFFFKQKTAYEMRISDWSSDVCSSDLYRAQAQQARAQIAATLAGADTIRSQVTEQDSSIRQARAQLAAKRAALDLANEQLARYRPLAATGAEPREKLQQYETQAQQAHADFVAAQAAVSADRKSTRLNSSH